MYSTGAECISPASQRALILWARGARPRTAWSATATESVRSALLKLRILRLLLIGQDGIKSRLGGCSRRYFLGGEVANLACEGGDGSAVLDLYSSLQGFVSSLHGGKHCRHGCLFSGENAGGLRLLFSCQGEKSGQVRDVLGSHLRWRWTRRWSGGLRKERTYAYDCQHRDGENSVHRSPHLY